MKIIRNSIIVLCILGLILALSLIDLNSVKSNQNVIILWNNLKLLSKGLFTLIPVLILVLLVFLLFINKWSFRVEKLSIGGFNILFDNPNHLFCRQVKAFLDTKRTVFRIDFKKDNFKETLDSYYEVYKFFRDEIKVIGKIKENQRAKNLQTKGLYNISNEAIKVLNNFLTEHQSDYRRWYTYQEKEHDRDFYNLPIGDLQQRYTNYEHLCEDFKKVNEFFTTEIAKKFDIDIEKWGIKK